MPLSGLIARLETQTAGAAERVGAQFNAWASSGVAVAQALTRAEERLELREENRLRRLLGQVNLDRVRDLCLRGDAGQLHRRERRAIVAGFSLLGPEVVEAGLRAIPELRPLYLRRLFRQWAGSRQGAHWDRFVAGLGVVRAEEEPVTGLPLDCVALLRNTGPTELARRLGHLELSAFVDQLRSAGVKSRWAFWRECLLAWFVANRPQPERLTRALSWVMKTPEARVQLVPLRRGEDTGASIDLQLQASFVAVILGARAEQAIPDDAAAELESLLLSSDLDLGDPRLEVSRGWDPIRQQEPAGFALLLRHLVLGDLGFFFDHAVEAGAERRAFWLRYARSLRRTRLLLAPDTRTRLAGAAPELPERMRAAFTRADALRVGTPSALCLWFEHHVVVEESRSNGAVHLYPRELFEQKLLPPQRSPDDAKALLVQALCVDGRPVPRAGAAQKWQAAVETRLLQLGIAPDAG